MYPTNRKGQNASKYLLTSVVNKLSSHLCIVGHAALTPEKGPNHSAARRGCSSRRYQHAVIKMQAGNIPASRMPSNKRTKAALANPVQAAMVQRQPPHKTNEVPRYLPMGSRVNTHVVGNSVKKYPM